MLYRACEINIREILDRYADQKRKRGNPRTKDCDYLYKDVVCAFDIETSLIRTGSGKSDLCSIMYIWQMQIGLDCTIYGRTWNEFLILMDDICAALMKYCDAAEAYFNK